MEVTRRQTKSIRIVVEPPEGRVRVSAPRQLGDLALGVAIQRRLGWIRKHRTRMAAMDRSPCLGYVDGERLRWLGLEVELRVVPGGRGAKARLLEDDRIIELRVGKGCSLEGKAAAIGKCYRTALKGLLPELAEKWEAVLGVKVWELRIKTMRTRWGSCNTKVRRIWLNLELARRPFACLEYVLVHEMAHLIERGHGPAFKAILDRCLPEWRTAKKLLGAEGHRAQGSPLHGAAGDKVQSPLNSWNPVHLRKRGRSQGS